MHMGSADETVKHYLSFLESTASNTDAGQQHVPVAPSTKVDRTKIHADLFGGRLEKHPKVTQAAGSMLNAEYPAVPLCVHSAATVRVSVTLASHICELHVNVPIYRKSDGMHVTKLSTQGSSVLSDVHEGSFSLEFNIPDLNLHSGEYVAFLAVFEGHSFIYRDCLFEFQVLRGNRLFFPNNLLDLACTVALSSPPHPKVVHADV
jgi:hypothetical protein